MASRLAVAPLRALAPANGRAWEVGALRTPWHALAIAIRTHTAVSMENCRRRLLASKLELGPRSQWSPRAGLGWWKRPCTRRARAYPGSFARTPKGANAQAFHEEGPVLACLALDELLLERSLSILPSD